MMGRRSNDKSDESEIIGAKLSEEMTAAGENNSVQELATQMAQLDESHKKQFEVFEKKIKKLESRNGTLEKLAKEQAEKMGRMEGQMKQLEKEKKALEEQVGEHDTMEQEQNEEMTELKERVVELEKKVGVSKSVEKPAEKAIKREWRVDLEQWQEKEKSGKAQKRRGTEQEELKNVAKQQKVQGEKEEEQKLAQIAEYARVIAVPTVTYLQRNYNRELLLQLIQHGNDITKSIYIQLNQCFSDDRIVQNIVDLLVEGDKLEKMIGEVTIESCIVMDWPLNKQLKLKERKSNVAYTFNEASAHPDKYSYSYSAEYELASKNNRFYVLIYYVKDDDFNKWVDKFIYRRLA